MASIDQIRASDGSGNANVATVQSSRSGGASTIIVDTVLGINDTFMATMGTPHTFTDPITSETITVISEATAVDFAGHVDGSNLEIDTIAPGYTDGGSEVGDIVIIRPTTQWSDNVAEVLDEEHEDDGTHGDITPTSVASSGPVSGTGFTVTGQTTGLLGATHNYTYVSPDIFIDGVDQNNGDNTVDWTKPANLKFIEVEVVGGGGGSGGADNQDSTGGGGGGGGYSYKRIAAGDLGATEVVTVGAGGTAGAGDGSGSGGTGGTSSFGAHATATGGVGGVGNSAGAGGSGGGGTGGAGTSGNINLSGSDGGYGISAGSNILRRGGQGGSSKWAGATTQNQSGADGVAGKTYGGGAAGATANSTANRAGAVGGAGIVIVKEYF